MRFDPTVIENDPERRRILLTMLEAAVAAVEPSGAVRRALSRTGEAVLVGDRPLPLSPQGRILLLGLGKAAPAMAAGAIEALGGALGALVAAPRESTPAPGVELLPGGHPLPDEGSIVAGERILSEAAGAGDDDLVIFLVSGGGSACAEVPLPGLRTDELREVTAALLRSGAPITDVNIVRRHLSRLKGGRLAAAARPARVVTLILSDVVGNRLPAIAGGPTVADPTTPEQARDVLERLGIDPPDRVLAVLAGAGAPPPPTHFAADTVMIVGDGATAAEGARRAAAGLGLAAEVIDTEIIGEARSVGARLARRGTDLPGPAVLVAAGETTVEVLGGGRGGRNQELALAAGIALAGDERVVVASLGTDGVDGPTAAAGGIGDGETVERGRRIGLDAVESLDDNDSGGYLGRTGDLLTSGPTGTNVGDVMVVLRSR